MPYSHRSGDSGRPGGYGEFDQLAGQRGDSMFSLSDYLEAKTLRDLKEQMRMMESGMLTPEQAFPAGSPITEKFERYYGTPVPGPETVQYPVGEDPTTGEPMLGPETQVPGLGIGSANVTAARMRTMLAKGLDAPEQLMAASGMIKSKAAADILAPATRNALFRARMDAQARPLLAKFQQDAQKNFPNGSPQAWNDLALTQLAANPQFAHLAKGVTPPSEEQLGPQLYELKSALKMREESEKQAAITGRMEDRYKHIDALAAENRALQREKAQATDARAKDRIQAQIDANEIKRTVAKVQNFTRTYGALTKDFGGETAFDIAQSVTEHGGNLTGVEIPAYARQRARTNIERADAIDQAKLDNVLSIIKKRESDLPHAQMVDLAKLELAWTKIDQAANLGQKDAKVLRDHIKSLQNSMETERKPGGSPERMEEIAQELYPLMGFQTSKGAGLLNRMFGIGGSSTTIKSGGQSYTPQSTPEPLSLTGGRPPLQVPPALEQLRNKAQQDLTNLNQALPAAGKPPIKAGPTIWNPPPKPSLPPPLSPSGQTTETFLQKVERLKREGLLK